MHAAVYLLWTPYCVKDIISYLQNHTVFNTTFAKIYLNFTGLSGEVDVYFIEKTP